MTDKEKMLSDQREVLSGMADLTGFLTDELGGDISLNQLRLLMEIVRASAADQPIDMRDISRNLNLDRRYVSRHIVQLADTERKHIGALIAQHAPVATEDKRVKGLSLTDAGVGFAQRLSEFVAGQLLRFRPSVEDLFFGETVHDTGAINVGVDERLGVAVYAIGTAFDSETYRRILAGMDQVSGYRFDQNELIDLRNSSSFEFSDADVELLIAAGQAFPPLQNRRMCFVVNEESTHQRGQEIEAQCAEGGFPNLSFFRTLSEAKMALGLPEDWAFPPMIPLPEPQD